MKEGRFSLFFLYRFFVIKAIINVDKGIGEEFGMSQAKIIKGLLLLFIIGAVGIILVAAT
ncbi:hypothetical protein BTS2_3795 [Bacillus sp. TS-2]|nr:hypothetical protein BTS2_3795 [Bacillus sp. TS-2]